jgi:hypothetical protein
MAASAPFQSRELNGELLLDELADLRQAQVQQKHLNDCAANVRGLSGMRVAEAAQQLRAIASTRFAAQPALAALLVRWSGKLKSEVDVSVLVGHLERLAFTAAIVGAVKRCAERLPRSGR